MPYALLTLGAAKQWPNVQTVRQTDRQRGKQVRTGIKYGAYCYSIKPVEAHENPKSPIVNHKQFRNNSISVSSVLMNEFITKCDVKATVSTFEFCQIENV